ncbi:hypothetical protein I5907_15840 [Panacibacter sp. DH6]|uniref:DUF7674 domain-containing protein n=1 Tax=Panacibacter microcysteis TaxID=2793269 RepID=A0A931GY93_9BACT|nr:hypothetical protein [Panacibacter microcysteis]MBG9377714.1 hypothetical protein [Panacibacter microcysteis]
MINYYNIPDELKKQIPEFSFEEEEFTEMSTVVFSFFSGFIEENLTENNADVLERCAKFIDELCESENDKIGPLLDEIFLGVYNTSTHIHEKFFKLLSLLAKKRMELTISYWRRQENIQ